MAAFFFSFFHQIKNKRIFSTSASSNIFEKTIGNSGTCIANGRWWRLWTWSIIASLLTRHNSDSTSEKRKFTSFNHNALKETASIESTLWRTGIQTSKGNSMFNFHQIQNLSRSHVWCFTITIYIYIYIYIVNNPETSILESINPGWERLVD
jgi:hypothetical protein